jgi:hypothetical protein
MEIGNETPVPANEVAHAKRESLKYGHSPDSVRRAAKAVALAVAEQKQARAAEQNALDALRRETSSPTPDAAAIRAKSEAWEKSEAVLEEKQEKVRQAREALTKELVASKDRQWLAIRSFALGLVLVFGEYWLIWGTQPAAYDRDKYVYLLLVSLGTSLLAVLVYQATQKFVWFGVAAFLAIAIFQGFATHVAITSTPKVEPVAALVGGLPPIKGVFVAQTSDRIYLGYPIGKSASLLALRRDRVSGLAIGRLVRNGHAARELVDKLAATLCSQVPSASAATKGKSAATAEQAPKCPK